MPGTPPTLCEIITDALRYWERRRVYFNAALLVLVLLHFFKQWLQPSGAHDFPGGMPALGLQEPIAGFSFRWLLLIAVHINVIYCAVYIVDVFVQLSDFRSSWKEYRWMLLAGMFVYIWAGTIF